MMSSPEASPKRRRPIAAAVGLSISALLILLSAMVWIPTYTMWMFPLTVGSSEMSPLLVILDLVWCIVVNRLLAGYGVARGVTMALLVLAGLAAVRPLTQYTTVAAAAAEQMGTEAMPPRFSLVAAVRGLPTSADVVERTIAYAADDGTPLSMRLYAQGGAQQRPLVVVIYGGAWRNGSATQCENVSRALASRGYAVAAIDYRHAPRFQYPTQLVDVRRSLALLRDSASAWKLDTARIALLGRSAGGHLAELAAYAPGDVPVQAVIALYAPHDLVQGYRDLPSPDPIDVREVLRGFLGGTPEEQATRYHDGSPSTHVRRGLPPTLLIFGGRDRIVKPSFNRGAASRLRAANVPVVSVELPWAEHGFDMAPSGLGAQLAFNVILDFLARELRH